MNTTKNKKRAANFSSKEENLLVGLTRKYKTVIECKLTDMKTHSDKTICWSKIEDEFNSSSGDVYRPKDVLRKKYENIKKRAKKKYAEDKSYTRGTGGGPPRFTDFTSVDEDIKEFLGKEIEIEGFTTESGGDVNNVIQKYFEKEQEMKLQFLREKHELDLKLMQQKAHLQMENEKREHELRVEILILEKQKLLQKM